MRCEGGGYRIIRQECREHGQPQPTVCSVKRTGQKRTVVVDYYSTWGKRRADSYFAQIHANAHVPLIAGGKMIGLLGVAFTDENSALYHSDVALMEQFAALAAVALVNARLYTSLTESDKRLQESYQDLSSAHEELFATEEELRAQYDQAIK